MKKYEQKKRPTFQMPGGDDMKKNLLYGVGMLIALFVLVVILSRSSILGGQSLAEYRQTHAEKNIGETTETTLEDQGVSMSDTP